MKQSQLIKIIDLFSLLSLALMVSTGILLQFTLPARSGQSTVWGMTRHEWGDIHLYFSIAFLIMMSLHFLTHIKYIKQVILGNAQTEYNYRIVVGLIGLIALVLVLLAPTLSSVEEGQRGGRGYGAQNWQMR